MKCAGYSVTFLESSRLRIARRTKCLTGDLGLPIGAASSFGSVPVNADVRLMKPLTAVGCPLVLKRKHYVDISRALLGETRIGVVGVLLQWLTLAILISIVLWIHSLTPRAVIALTLVGVSALIVGLVLTFRGHSLGPIIVIPGVFAIVILVTLTVLLYPLRWLTKET